MTDENGSAARPDVASAPGSDTSLPSSDPDTPPGETPSTSGESDAAPDNGSTAAGRRGRSGDGSSGPPKLRDLVDEPAKVMRIGTMIKQLLEEVRNAPLDDAARNRLAEIFERSLRELEDGLAPELVDELHRVNLPFLDDTVPTDAELRIAQAQMVGWLEGLFRGIQTAIAAEQTANQQMASRLQLRQLPPGTVLAPGVVIGDNGEPRRADPTGQSHPSSARPEPHAGPGQYL